MSPGDGHDPGGVMGKSLHLALIALLAIVIAAGSAGPLAASAPARAGHGVFVWKKSLDPTPTYDDLSLCARGPGATVYACGGRGWPSAIDIWLVKRSAAGAPGWSHLWDGPDGLADNAEGMVVDGAGNVYVCGTTQRTGGDTDSVVLKYDASGTLKWQTIYDPEGLTDGARAIGLDAAGDVYVAGWSATSGSGNDVYTAKFRSAGGTRVWTSWYSGPQYDDASGIAVTSGGVCYTIGVSNPVNGKADALLVKTTATGAQAWAKRWNGPKDRNDEWNSVALSRSGSVCVAGTTNALGAADIVAARYSSAGKRLWLRTWGSRGGQKDYAKDLAVARDGSAWVAGMTDRGEGDMRTALVKWSSSGKLRFARAMGSRKTSADLSSVIVDAHGDAFVAGNMITAGSGGWKLLAAKYAPSGKLGWRSLAAHNSGSDDLLYDMVFGGPGFLYGCGVVGSTGADSRGVLVKIRR